MELSKLNTRIDLANYLGVKPAMLSYVLFKEGIDSYYKTFEISKKSGGSRTINAPTGSLKFIQKRLLKVLNLYQDKYFNNKFSHAFDKRYSIITNAKVHINKKYIINVDLKDYFSSINFGRVLGFFKKSNKFNLNDKVAVTIAQIVCYDNKLPQGAPTSPVITNFITQIMDRDILKLIGKYKLRYSRYADDLTFSTNNGDIDKELETFISELTKVVEKNGFKINEHKTRIQYNYSQQTVTGLVTNKIVNIPRNYFDKTKAMAHTLYTTGEFMIDGKPGTVQQLEGRFAYIDTIEKEKNKVNNKRRKDNRLTSREWEYKLFLFYKNFYNNNKPIILTEGKTDVLYIKAALKSLYMKYPNLITKNNDKKFEYKVKFISNTRKTNYYFNIYGGGSTIQTLYHDFINDDKNKKAKALMKYFKVITKGNPKNPTIFVFDNEQITNKPLKKFLSQKSISEKVKNEVRDNNFSRINEKESMYILTNKLMNTNQESEIEDLFSEDTLSTKLNEKTFNKANNFNTDKHYGKDIFSKYVLENYEKINFDNFVTMLDNIEKIVEDYKTNT